MRRLVGLLALAALLVLGQPLIASCAGPAALAPEPPPVEAAVPIAPAPTITAAERSPRVLGLSVEADGYALLDDGSVWSFPTDADPIVARVAGIDDAVQIDAHLEVACARRRSGRVTCFGQPPRPEWRGAGHDLRAGPTDLAGIDDAIDLVAGSHGGCVLRASGELACWGEAVDGHDAPDRPRRVAMPAPIVDLVRSGYDLRAIAADGRTFRWDGAGRRVEEAAPWERRGTRLEDGRAFDERGVPYEVELHEPLAIARGFGGVCVIERDRGVACLATYAEGEGARTVHRVAIPDAREVHLAGYRAYVLHGARGIATFRLASSEEPATSDLVELEWRVPFAPSDPGPAVDLASGTGYACALHAGGAVRCWGSDAWGQLGDGDPAVATAPVWVHGLDDAVAIATEVQHACAARRDGSVVCWGRTSSGALGAHATALAPRRVDDVEGAIDVAVAYELSCALLESGRVRCWGDARSGAMGPDARGPRVPPTDVAGVEDAVAIAAGYHSLAVVRRDGTIRTFGRIAGGAAVRDVPTLGARAIAVDVGSAAGACHATHDDRVLCDGMPPLRGRAFAIDAPRACASGEHGVVCVERGGTPETIPGLEGATSLVIEDRSVCGIVRGEVRCVGGVAGTWLGELVPGIEGATAVLALEHGGCAITPAGTRCWGGATLPATAVAAAGGAEGGACWIESGVVSCRGPDDAAVTTLRGVAGATRLAVGHGVDEVCALAGADAWCWIGGRARRTARDVLDVSLTSRVDRERHACVVARDGRVRCGSPARLRDTAATVAVELAASGSHGCARLATGEVSCWGAGVGDDPPNVLGTCDTDVDDPRVHGIHDAIAIAAGGDATCVVRADHTVACWGAGRVVRPVSYAVSPLAVPGLSGVTAISLAGSHACAVVEGGRVRCWGRRSRDADLFGDERAGAVTVPLP